MQKDILIELGDVIRKELSECDLLLGMKRKQRDFESYQSILLVR